MAEKQRCHEKVAHIREDLYKPVPEIELEIAE
jgi:hypothetical protein